MEETVVPLRLESGEEGALTIRREGPRTALEGRCPDPGRLVRLWVFGPGEEAYLGVMIPEKGEARIRRTLTRREREAFPSVITAAGEKTREKRKTPPPPEPTDRGRITDVLWYPVGDGSLYTRREDGVWRAYPLAGPELPAGAAERRTIEGVDYALFRLEGAGEPSDGRTTGEG